MVKWMSNPAAVRSRMARSPLLIDRDAGSHLDGRNRHPSTSGRSTMPHHRLSRLAATLTFLAALIPGIAQAHYHAPLWMGASEEVPTNSSTAIAIGNIDIINGPNGDSLRVNITYQGLSAGATAAHIHRPAYSGQNAGVLIPLTITSGSTSGTIAQNFLLTQT